jgi:hypothetical protein
MLSLVTAVTNQMAHRACTCANISFSNAAASRLAAAGFTAPPPALVGLAKPAPPPGESAGAPTLVLRALAATVASAAVRMLMPVPEGERAPG